MQVEHDNFSDINTVLIRFCLDNDIFFSIETFGFDRTIIVYKFVYKGKVVQRAFKQDDYRFVEQPDLLVNSLIDYLRYELLPRELEAHEGYIDETTNWIY